jgi:hypothetical protein
MQAAGSTGGEGVPLGGGLKNWTTNSSWFAGDIRQRIPLHTASNSSTAGGDAGLSRLLSELPSLQAAGYILHSRWFSNQTDYAQQNGGKFKFAVEDDSSAFPGNGELTIPPTQSCERRQLTLT